MPYKYIIDQDCGIAYRVFEKGKNKCYQYWPDTLQSVVELELYTLTCSEVEFHDVYACCLIRVKNKKVNFLMKASLKPP